MRNMTKVLLATTLIGGILGGIGYGLGGGPIVATEAQAPLESLPVEIDRNAVHIGDRLPRLLELKPDADGKLKVAVGRAGEHPRLVELGKLKDFTVMTAGGKEVSKDEALKKLAAGGLVVVSANGLTISPDYLKVFQDDVLVLISPDLAVRGADDSTTSSARSARWIINFKTDSGEDYLKQLAAFEAKLLIPQPPDWKKNIQFDELKPNAGKAQAGELPNMFFIDSDKGSAAKVAHALKLEIDPPHFVAYFPKKVEEDLAAKERAFHDRKEEEIRSTTFRVIERNGKYEMKVTDQLVNAKDVPKVLTPAAEKYQALVKAHDRAAQEYSDAWRAAKTEEERQKLPKDLTQKATADFYGGQFLALIREHPKDPAALDAIRWLLSRIPSREETATATDIVLRNWIEDERLAGVCQTLWHHSDRTGDQLLRTAIEKSPHRAVQGYARFSLATSLKKDADRRAEGEPAEREPFEREAEQLYQQVIDKFADLKHITTLGKEAEAALFEMRYLSIGKTPPDIEGTDLDGKKMKLTDFRGKVVLMTFCGSWCGFCTAEVPQELALLKRFDDKPFAIVGVNNDKDVAVARKWGVDTGITWRSFWDGEKGPITTKWNVQAWPTLYLLDGKGVIRYKGDNLRATSVREDKNGKLVQFWFLDDAVDSLMKEAATKKPE